MVDATRQLLDDPAGKVDSEVEKLFKEQGFLVEQPEEDEIAIVEDAGLFEFEKKNTALKKLSKIEPLWAEKNKQLIRETKDLDRLKISCFKCLKAEFKDLDSAPIHEDFRTMKFIEQHKDEKTKVKGDSMSKVRVLVGNEYLFKCECCDAGCCVYMEVE